MALEFLRITPETSWGVYNSGGTHTIIQLDQSNAFTMRPKPIFWTIRTAGGFNRRWQKGSAKTAVSGTLNTLVYGSQAGVWSSWIQPTGTPLNLTSYTVDHCIVSEDGSRDPVYRRHLGTLVDQADFSASENDQLMRLSLQLTAQQTTQITATDFPEPAASAYPADAPYVLEHAAGGFVINDGTNTPTNRTGFESFNCSIKNFVDKRFFESQFISAYSWHGRDVDFKSKWKYAYLFDRPDFEAVQKVTANITFSNGTGQILQSDVTVAASGSAYVAPKAVVSGTGTGAEIELVLGTASNAGKIVAAIVTAPGYGYTGTPTVTITDSAGSSGSVTIALSSNHTMEFNFETNSYLDDVMDDLGLDKVFLQELSHQAYYDVSNTSDFAITTT